MSPPLAPGLALAAALTLALVLTMTVVLALTIRSKGVNGLAPALFLALAMALERTPALYQLMLVFLTLALAISPRALVLAPSLPLVRRPPTVRCERVLVALVERTMRARAPGVAGQPSSACDSQRSPRSPTARPSVNDHAQAHQLVCALVPLTAHAGANAIRHGRRRLCRLW
jgi:hypothetical protein